MYDTNKNIKRRILCINLMLASLTFSISTSAAVTGHGVDPSQLQTGSSAVETAASTTEITISTETQATPYTSSETTTAAGRSQGPSGTAETAAETTAAAKLPPTEGEIGNYFSSAYVIGDSVAYGFQLYAARNKANSPIFQNLNFLTRESFSVHNAFMAISSKSYHPIYQGAQHHIWETLQMVGAKHVYTFFGLNDLNIGGVEGTVDYYQRLLDQIKSVNPDVDFTIISTTPMYRGSERKKLTNANIDALNARLQTLCAANGWGYVDIASHLKDADGTLAAQYCSDHYVHETNAAYAVWLQAFHDYAQAQLMNR